MTPTPAQMTDAHRLLLERFWAGSDYLERRRWERKMRRARAVMVVREAMRLEVKAA